MNRKEYEFMVEGAEAYRLLQLALHDLQGAISADKLSVGADKLSVGPATLSVADVRRLLECDRLYYTDHKAREEYDRISRMRLFTTHQVISHLTWHIFRAACPSAKHFKFLVKQDSRRKYGV